jgi:hypothetical protein
VFVGVVVNVGVLVGVFVGVSVLVGVLVFVGVTVGVDVDVGVGVGSANLGDKKLYCCVYFRKRQLSIVEIHVGNIPPRLWIQYHYYPIPNV